MATTKKTTKKAAAKPAATQFNPPRKCLSRAACKKAGKCMGKC